MWLIVPQTEWSRRRHHDSACAFSRCSDRQMSLEQGVYTCFQFGDITWERWAFTSATTELVYMKLKKLSVALLLAGSTMAFANTNLGNLNTIPFQQAVVGIAGFSSGYDFSLSNASSFSTSLFGWNMSSLTLVNNANGWNSTQSFSNSMSGSFGGTAGATSMAAPVPEAQNFAMLLVGIAGVGFTSLRRRRVN